MRTQELGHRLLDVIFPPRCRWCGRVTREDGACDCKQQPTALRLPVRPLMVDAAAGHTSLAELWACWRYDGAVREALHRFKFEGADDLAVAFGDDLVACCKAAGLATRYDLIIPAPVSADTRRRRGHNQSALLARQLAHGAALACDETALKKQRPTPPQMSLGRAERLKNLKGAFAADPARVAGRRVLLVDDIVTTGSTLNECAATLLAAGAVSCGAVCVAATPLGAPQRAERSEG